MWTLPYSGKTVVFEVNRIEGTSPSVLPPFQSTVKDEAGSYIIQAVQWYVVAHIIDDNAKITFVMRISINVVWRTVLLVSGWRGTSRVHFQLCTKS